MTSSGASREKGNVTISTCPLFDQWCVFLVMTLLCPPGDGAAAPQSQEEAPAAPPLVGEDAELVEQLRKVRTSICSNW